MLKIIMCTNLYISKYIVRGSVYNIGIPLILLNVESNIQTFDTTVAVGLSLWQLLEMRNDNQKIQFLHFTHFIVWDNNYA